MVSDNSFSSVLTAFPISTPFNIIPPKKCFNQSFIVRFIIWINQFSDHSFDSFYKYFAFNWISGISDSVSVFEMLWVNTLRAFFLYIPIRSFLQLIHKAHRYSSLDKVGEKLPAHSLSVRIDNKTKFLFKSIGIFICVKSMQKYFVPSGLRLKKVLDSRKTSKIFWNKWN